MMMSPLALGFAQDLLLSLGITGESTADGAVFRGAEMIYNYERLLRQVLNLHAIECFQSDTIPLIFSY